MREQWPPPQQSLTKLLLSPKKIPNLPNPLLHTNNRPTLLRPHRRLINNNLLNNRNGVLPAGLTVMQHRPFHLPTHFQEKECSTQFVKLAGEDEVEER